jgi:hypothetical protein
MTPIDPAFLIHVSTRQTTETQAGINMMIRIKIDGHI